MLKEDDIFSKIPELVNTLKEIPDEYIKKNLDEVWRKYYEKKINK